MGFYGYVLSVNVHLRVLQGNRTLIQLEVRVREQA